MNSILEPTAMTLDAQRAGWIDVSVPVRDGMVHWPDNPPVRVEKMLDIEKGDKSTVSSISFGAHTGTHVDAPVHFIKGGTGVDEIPLGNLIGSVRVIGIFDVQAITADDLRKHRIQDGERILLKTTNSGRCWNDDTFVTDYVYLSADGARYLVERKVRTVGIDYLSIAGGTEGADTHSTLLRAGICVIEGINLSGVKEGHYEMICLPLRMQHGDGAPSRMLLRAIE